MKKTTKLMSLLLAMLLVFSLMSTAAFAEAPPAKDRVQEVLSKLTGKFLEDPKGTIDKVDKMFTLIDVGEDVISIVYHYDRMKDTFEDAKFEAEALRKKIKFDIDNIGKPDDPIGEAQVEIDNFVDREKHEGDQINEDIDNVNKLGSILGRLTGKDIPKIPAFEYEPYDLQLKPLIEGSIEKVLGKLFK